MPAPIAPATAPTAPPTPADPSVQALGLKTFAHLQAVVAIDSASDEASPTIPSSPGQRILATYVGDCLRAYGLTVTEDAHANVIGFLPGRAGGEAAPAIALMVHLDTARGTAALPELFVHPAWDGSALTFTANATIRVDTTTYPELARYVGHTIVHGTGDAPFGLDDKLGLAHLLTLAEVLAARPEWPAPPLYLVGRPDEEIGRMEAVDALAEHFAALGVRSGYTVDGLLPYEVNTDNFNAAHATLTFAPRPIHLSAARARIRLGGVNTHGATAHTEGHRAATRFAVEIVAQLAAEGIAASIIGFESDALRDCDAILELAIDPGDATRVEAAIHAVVGPHIVRGATLSALEVLGPVAEADGALGDIFAFVARFLRSNPGWPLLAEDSDGWFGYSHPYRVRSSPSGHTLDIRIRDFDPALLAARKAHIADLARAAGLADEAVLIRDQYINMGPSLASRPDLVTHAVEAGLEVGVDAERMPIRGGTGVDPFLARGTAIANLGTGYFAPESEKELTSIETMAGHARWLLALVRRLALTP